MSDDQDPLPPTIREQILEWLPKQEKPVLVSEISAALNVPHSSLTAELQRQAKRNEVRRLKVPMTFPYHPHPGHTKTRRVWLYQAA